MNPQQQINFQRIADAISYLTQSYKDQPSLEEVAKKVHLSPFHFQRLFTEWAGVSPKKFLQFLTLSHAKAMLAEGITVWDATIETGLTATSRLHELFVKIEGMSPGEYKNGGAALVINHSFADSPFGTLLVASTHKGVCHMAFANDEEIGLKNLIGRFPNARFKQRVDYIQQNALRIFSHDWKHLDKIKLHLKGTPFQLQVWATLLNIPTGNLKAYSDIARYMQQPHACRAVGTAVGQNPVAYIIPCHRVIQSSGTFGNYCWGPHRKKAMIGWEAAKAAGKCET